MSLASRSELPGYKPGFTIRGFIGAGLRCQRLAYVLRVAWSAVHTPRRRLPKPVRIADITTLFATGTLREVLVG